MSTYIVTGGCGFIGSNLTHSLLADGCRVIVIDTQIKAAQAGIPKGAQFWDAGDFRERLVTGSLDIHPRAIFHQGACSDTMETREDYVIDLNVRYSSLIFAYASQVGIPFIYASSASVYGMNENSLEDYDNERPINLYAESKMRFDDKMRANWNASKASVVGLRYFNVYGPNERHKGRMASMAYQAWKQLRETGRIKLFGEYGGYGPGEQRRDFIHVDDVVKVNRFFAEKVEPIKGIFNVGTGVSSSFNELAHILIGLLGGGDIEYVNFPESLKGKYQVVTRAHQKALREAGFTGVFGEIREGLAKSVGVWQSEVEE